MEICEINAVEFKYCKAFCGNDPQLYEEDVFKFVLSLTPHVTPQATEQVTVQVTVQVTAQATPQATPKATPKDEFHHERIQKLLVFCEHPRSRSEMQDFTGLIDREYFRLNILIPLINKGLLFLTDPNKPKSPNQKYYSKKTE